MARPIIQVTVRRPRSSSPLSFSLAQRFRSIYPRLGRPQPAQDLPGHGSSIDAGHTLPTRWNHDQHLASLKHCVIEDPWFDFYRSSERWVRDVEWTRLIVGALSGVEEKRRRVGCKGSAPALEDDGLFAANHRSQRDFVFE